MTITHVRVGGYTTTMGGDALGIGLLRWNHDGAGLEVLDTTPTSSPSFLAAGFNGLLYATDEAGRIEAFRPGPRLTLQPLGGQPTSGGFPCHVSVTLGRLFVSNYLDGSIDVFSLTVDGRVDALIQTLPSEGSGPNPVQQGPHAHSTLLCGSTLLGGSTLPGGSTLLSADLGADRVHVHALERGQLVRTASVALPPGTGPRDLIAHAGRTIVLGELDGGLFALDERGRITAAGSVSNDWFEGDHAAGFAIDTAGRFGYTGLRGSNRIAVFRAADLSPVTTVSCGGDWPRHLCVITAGDSGDVLLVANQLSSTVAAFALDPNTGIPVPLGSPVNVASPTFLLPVI